MADPAFTGEKSDEEEVDVEDLSEAKLERLNADILEKSMQMDTDGVLSLLESKADAACKDKREWSPLIWAAFHGDEKLVGELIKLDAHLEYKDSKRKHTPLHWAAFQGQTPVVKLLLDHFSTSDKDHTGNTALHQAVAGGHYTTVETLLAAKADVQAINRRRHTPLALCTEPRVRVLLG
eukprot:GEMP01094030.1.p1 GENE.GEMP01094030.1~~GEMP01094030.1.p1  ORF type:complete len:179 (+),score=53.62 GEMP01094030.1:124-660(+)